MRSALARRIAALELKPAGAMISAQEVAAIRSALARKLHCRPNEGRRAAAISFGSINRAAELVHLKITHYLSRDRSTYSNQNH